MSRLVTALPLVLLASPAHARYLRARMTQQNSSSCELLSTATCLCDTRDDPKSDFQQAIEWIFIVVLLMLSGVFSGLNLGLLGLDLTGLEVVAKGDADSRNAKYARAIMPVRKYHNWLLCSLLLGNVMTNSGISILLADKTTGLMGFIIATGAPPLPVRQTTHTHGP